MSVVLGLDLSLTSAGVVILRNGTPTLIRSVGHKGRDGASYHERSRRVRSQCRAVMAIVDKAPHAPGQIQPLGERVDLAVIEGPLMHGPAQAYEFDRAALWHGVYGALEAKGVPIAVVNPMTLKLWFTGAGDASKRRMCDTARLMFREPVTTSDEADALGLATAGAWWLGDRVEGDRVKFEPNQRQLDALTKVEWPEGVKSA